MELVAHQGACIVQDCALTRVGCPDCMSVSTCYWAVFPANGAERRGKKPRPVYRRACQQIFG